jgi:hypothetical protein
MRVIDDKKYDKIDLQEKENLLKVINDSAGELFPSSHPMADLNLSLREFITEVFKGKQGDRNTISYLANKISPRSSVGDVPTNPFKKPEPKTYRWAMVKVAEIAKEIASIVNGNENNKD